MLSWTWIQTLLVVLVLSYLLPQWLGFWRHHDTTPAESSKPDQESAPKQQTTEQRAEQRGPIVRIVQRVRHESSQFDSTRGLYATTKISPQERHIRLLSIASADKYTDPMIADLSVHSLNNVPKYVALSYVWGDRKSVDKVYCNGHDIPISANLSQAMRTLRKLNFKYVWIDQVCINQGVEGESDTERDKSRIESDAEKKWQVVLMKDIFSSATKVVIHLGRENESSIQAIRHWREVKRQIDAHTDRERQGLRRNPDFNFDSWLEFSHLYDYDWFSNVWAIQEWLLAKDYVVAIGPEIYPGLDLFTGIGYVLNHLNELTYGGRNLNFTIKRIQEDGISLSKIELLQSWRFFKRAHWSPGIKISHTPSIFSTTQLTDSSPTLDILYCLRQVKKFDAKDLHDKIYALAPLFGIDVEADYKSSVVEVYTNFGSKLVQNGRLIECLKLASRSQQSLQEPLENLPSWVPDWTAAEVWCALKLSHNTPSNPFPPSKYPLRGEMCGDDKTLRIDGVFVDSIAAMSDPFPIKDLQNFWRIENLASEEWERVFDWHERAKNFVSNQKFGNTRYLRTKSRLKILARLISGDLQSSPNASQDTNSTTDDRLVSYQKTISELRQRRESDSPFLVFNMSSERDEQVRAMVQLLKINPQNQRLCVTSHGLLGLVPEKSRVKDKICLVPGMDCPLVFRPGESFWLYFVGGAWVIDIMTLLKNSDLGDIDMDPIYLR